MIRYESYTKHKLVSIVANTSFGVYFVHTFVIVGIKFISTYINQHFLLAPAFQFLPGNYIVHFFVTCITLALSILVVLAIKHILDDKTYILIGNIPSLRRAS